MQMRYCNLIGSHHVFNVVFDFFNMLLLFSCSEGYTGPLCGVCQPGYEIQISLFICSSKSIPGLFLNFSVLVDLVPSDSCCAGITRRGCRAPSVAAAPMPTCCPFSAWWPSWWQRQATMWPNDSTRPSLLVPPRCWSPIWYGLSLMNAF